MKMFKAVLFCVLFGVSVAMSPVNAAQPLNKVVAIVNDGVITQDELNQAIKGVQARMAEAHQPVASPSTLRSRVLDELILQKLEMQLADRAGIKISEADLNTAIARIAKSNHLSLAQLKEKIQGSGGNFSDFKKSIRQQMILATLQRQVVSQQIKVTDSEINAALGEIKQKMNAAQQFQLWDVVIPNGNQNQVSDIKRSLQKNISAASLKAQFPSVTFNDMGWQNPNTLPELFLAALKNAKAHAVIGPIRAPNGLHLLKVIDIKSGPSQTISRDQAKMFVMQQKSEAVLKKWLEKMRKTAYVKIVN